jgi:exodeoxyribonuclease (lambda-induced)
MKTHHIQQGDDSWLQLRAGKITASRCKDARDVLKSGKPSQKQIAYAAQVAVERIAHRPVDQSFQNWQMKEGQVQEPLARAAYEELTGYLVEEVGAFSTDDDHFLYSPDGAVGTDGLIEVKSLFSPDRIIQIVAGDDYSDFEDQCMFGLWLTGRKWIDLIVWAPALESIGLAMTITRIERDDDAIEAMERDLMAFAVLVRQFESALRKKAAANVDRLLLAA